jgi:hypothetical protein
MSDLENQTVREVRQMTDAELEREGWNHYRGKTPTVIVFEDGTKVYPSQDSEGNGPGALFGIDSNGRAFGFTHQ